MITLYQTKNSWRSCIPYMQVGIYGIKIELYILLHSWISYTILSSPILPQLENLQSIRAIKPMIKNNYPWKVYLQLWRVVLYSLSLKAGKWFEYQHQMVLSVAKISNLLQSTTVPGVHQIISSDVSLLSNPEAERKKPREITQTVLLETLVFKHLSLQGSNDNLNPSGILQTVWKYEARSEVILKIICVC